MSFQFWDNLFHQWIALENDDTITLDGPRFIGDLLNPNLLGLQNDWRSGFSLKYLPEPWWGSINNSIYSILINYNPKSGDESQSRSTIANLGFESYSDLVEQIVTGQIVALSPTNTFHYTRANQIHTALGMTEHLPYLSLELVPWHTQHAHEVMGYLNFNFKALFKNVIKFAANQSMRIEGRLNRKVLIRSANVELLCNLIRLHHLGQPEMVDGEAKNMRNAKYQRFRIDLWRDVEFICIWKKEGSNGLPNHEDLIDILDMVAP
jgi:hypothetical protein